MTILVITKPVSVTCRTSVRVSVTCRISVRVSVTCRTSLNHTLFFLEIGFSIEHFLFEKGEEGWYIIDQ